MFFTILQSEILNDWLRPSLGMKRLNPIENFAKNILRFLIGCFDLIPRGVNDLKCLSFKNKLWRCGGCYFKLLFSRDLFCCNRTAIPRLPLSVFSFHAKKRKNSSNLRSVKELLCSVVLFPFSFAKAWDPRFFIQFAFRNILRELKPYLHPLVHSTLLHPQFSTYHTQPESISFTH